MPFGVRMAAFAAPAMSLRLPPYRALPAPKAGQPLMQVPLNRLRPTQMCVGMAEVRSRQVDFSEETAEQRLRYLQMKPVPLVQNGSGQLWMVDRHHRLRGLIEIDPPAEGLRLSGPEGRQPG